MAPSAARLRSALPARKEQIMGKIIPRSFERIRSGEQLQPPTFHERRRGRGCWRYGGEVPAAHHLPERWRDWLSAVPGDQDGTNWRQIAIGANAI